MAAVILNDADIEERITPQLAISAMKSALIALQMNELVAPPRVSSNLGSLKLDFTTGALQNHWFGYRSNGISDNRSSEQVVVLQDVRTNSVQGVAIGHLLGPYRTGALGGVAVDLLARSDSRTLGILGSGPQAWSQLWAIASVRKIESVLLFSPNQQNRTSFALKAEEFFGIKASALDSAKDVVEQSDIVVLATNSSRPVIDAKWLKPGTHINSLGPKYENNSEFGFDLAQSCQLLVTDSITQLGALPSPLIIGPDNELSRVTSLSSILAGDSTGRRGQESSLFLSVGLAGTELFLLDALINA